MILSPRESSQTFDEILKKREPIAIDCEGISLGTKGQLTTVQVTIYLFVRGAEVQVRGCS